MVRKGEGVSENVTPGTDKIGNEAEEKQRVLGIVSQTLPLVNQISRLVAENVWQIPRDLVKPLDESRVVLAKEEDFQREFLGREIPPGKEKRTLGGYDLDTGCLGIDLDALSKVVPNLGKKIDDLRLKEGIDVDSLVVFYLLAHEGIIHGWEVEKELIDTQLQDLLREFAKKFVAPDWEEQIPVSDWDKMIMSAKGCSIIFRKPGKTNIVMMGRGINEAYAGLLTQDLMIRYLVDCCGLDGDDYVKVTSVLLLQTTRIDQLAHASVFQQAIGPSRFANLYFSGDFYADLPSRLEVQEMIDLLTKLHEGDAAGFFNRYLISKF